MYSENVTIKYVIKDKYNVDNLSVGAVMVEDSGIEKVSFDISVDLPSSFEEMVEQAGGEDALLAQRIRQIKVDLGNTEREKAKGLNGHTDKVILTPEQKAVKKAEQKAKKDKERAMLNALKANPELLASLGL